MPKVTPNPHEVGTYAWKLWNTRQLFGIPHRKKHKPKKRPRPKTYKAKPKPLKDQRLNARGQFTKKYLMARARDIWNVAVDRMAEYGIQAWPLMNRVIVDLSDDVTGNKKKIYEYAGIKGAADVTGITPDGRRIEVCCPFRKESSDDQQKFIRKINESGGISFAIWSIEDLDRKLQEHGYELSTKSDEEKEGQR